MNTNAIIALGVFAFCAAAQATPPRSIGGLDTARAGVPADSAAARARDSLAESGAISLLRAPCSFGIVFGVAGVSAQDVVAYVNQTVGQGAVTANSFASAAALSAAFTYNVSRNLDVAAEYSFTTNSYNFGDVTLGGYNFSYDINSVTIMAHRLFNEQYYGVAAGVGGGFTFGVFRQTLPDTYAAEHLRCVGGNIAAEIVLRSTFGKHLYLHTELRGVATFTGDLNDMGRTLYIADPQNPRNATLSTFGGSVGVGLDWEF